MKIRALEDTPRTRLNDKALLKAFLGLDQPKMTLKDITVKKHVNNSSGHGQSRPSGPTPPKMGTFNGKDQWLPYFLQFSLIENKYE